MQMRIYWALNAQRTQRYFSLTWTLFASWIKTQGKNKNIPKETHGICYVDKNPLKITLNFYNTET